MSRFDPFGDRPFNVSEMNRALAIIGPQHIGCGSDGKPRPEDCIRAKAAIDWAIKEAARRTAESN